MSADRPIDERTAVPTLARGLSGRGARRDPRGRREIGPLENAGERAWALLSNVNFAVAQIIVLAVMGTIGMTLQQLPGFAFRNASDYAAEMEKIHARYDAVLGSAAVGLFERIGLFHVFGSWWFSLALVVLLFSIVVCTLDRTPRLWSQSREVRVVQPDAYFDPSLPDRAALDGVDEAALVGVLRRHRFRVRRAEVPAADDLAAGGDVETGGGPTNAGPTVFVYGDRHQYTKLATLLTHLGLISFLVAAAVTSTFGFEAPLVVTNGGTSTVQAIGTPGLLVVRNNGFSAPRLASGAFADFTTDLSVFRDGAEIARKTIRVNDPLSIAGFTFHQNGFGPAPSMTIRGSDGALLWTGPVALTESTDGRPYGTIGVPGRDFGIQFVLDRDEAGKAVLAVVPYRVVGKNPDGSDHVQQAMPFVVPAGGSAVAAPGLDVTVALDSVSAYSLLIAKRDPGQGIVWGAFLLLLAGLLITFFLPRRRIWARLDPSGRLALVARADRYVDLEREFGRLLEDLVRVRRPAPH